MKMIGKALPLAVGAMLLIAGGASPAAEKQTYHQRIEQFFALLKEGKTAEAVNFIYSDNPWIGKNSDAVQNLLNQMASLDKLMGKFRNYELLQEKVVGDRFAYISYLAAYDRQPLRFVFEFYRPENEWMTFSFSLDDDLDTDVEAAAKQSILAH